MMLLLKNILLLPNLNQFDFTDENLVCIFLFLLLLYQVRAG